MPFSIDPIDRPEMTTTTKERIKKYSTKAASTFVACVWCLLCIVLLMDHTPLVQAQVAMRVPFGAANSPLIRSSTPSMRKFVNKSAAGGERLQELLQRFGLQLRPQSNRTSSSNGHDFANYNFNQNLIEQKSSDQFITDDELLEIQSYLERFGYMDMGAQEQQTQLVNGLDAYGELRRNNRATQIELAISLVQKMLAMANDGRISRSLADIVTKGVRCGNTDANTNNVGVSGANNGGGNNNADKSRGIKSQSSDPLQVSGTGDPLQAALARKMKFAQSELWRNNKVINYRIARYSSRVGVTRAQIDAVVARAFRRWSDAMNLNGVQFVQVYTNGQKQSTESTQTTTTTTATRGVVHIDIYFDRRLHRVESFAGKTCKLAQNEAGHTFNVNGISEIHINDELDYRSLPVLKSEQQTHSNENRASSDSSSAGFDLSSLLSLSSLFAQSLNSSPQSTPSGDDSMADPSMALSKQVDGSDLVVSTNSSSIITATATTTNSTTTTTTTTTAKPIRVRRSSASSTSTDGASTPLGQLVSMYGPHVANKIIDNPHIIVPIIVKFQRDPALLAQLMQFVKSLNVDTNDVLRQLTQLATNGSIDVSKLVSVVALALSAEAKNSSPIQGAPIAPVAAPVQVAPLSTTTTTTVISSSKKRKRRDAGPAPTTPIGQLIAAYGPQVVAKISENPQIIQKVVPIVLQIQKDPQLMTQLISILKSMNIDTNDIARQVTHLATNGSIDVPKLLAAISAGLSANKGRRRRRSTSSNGVDHLLIKTLLAQSQTAQQTTPTPAPISSIGQIISQFGPAIINYLTNHPQTMQQLMPLIVKAQRDPQLMAIVVQILQSMNADTASDIMRHAAALASSPSVDMPKLLAVASQISSAPVAATDETSDSSSSSESFMQFGAQFGGQEKPKKKLLVVEQVPNNLDLETVVAHEIGHALGFSHNLKSIQSIMHPYLNVGVRQLSADDRQLMQSIYGRQSVLSSASRARENRLLDVVSNIMSSTSDNNDNNQHDNDNKQRSTLTTGIHSMVNFRDIFKSMPAPINKLSPYQQHYGTLYLKSQSSNLE